MHWLIAGRNRFLPQKFDLAIVDVLDDRGETAHTIRASVAAMKSA
jgi:hypothetical protein